MLLGDKDNKRNFNGYLAGEGGAYYSSSAIFTKNVLHEMVRADTFHVLFHQTFQPNI